MSTGRPRSSDAIAYAFAYASAHDVDLTVLHAFQVEYVAGVISKLSAEDSNARSGSGGAGPHLRDRGGMEEKYPDVHVETVTLRDHPVDALVTPPRSQTSWSSVDAGEAASAVRSSARSVTVSFTTRTAPSPW